MSLEIRRKGNKNFTHIDSDFNNEYGANDITIIFEGNTVKLRSFNGRIIFKINGYDLSVITIYDDTASGSQENFNDINLFKQRLINLGYPFAGGSVSGGGIPEAPNDGQQYGRQSEGWTVVTGGSGGGIPEAPNDGQQYARQSEAWSVVTGGSVQSIVAGTNVTVDNTDPNNPIINASGGDATLTKDVNQVGHGFSVGNVIRLDVSNYVKAQADSVNNANAISFVVSVTDADNFVLQSEGYTNASLGLSNGDEAFLSTTVLGGIQTTEPTNGEINLYLGQQTPQGFLISISTGFVVGGGSSVVTTNPIFNISQRELYSFGDSITLGQGATTGNDYVELFSRLYNLTLNNLAVSGRGVWEATIEHNANIQSNNNYLSIYMAGFNDVRRGGNNAKTIAKITNCYKSSICNNFLNSYVPATPISDNVTATGFLTSFNASTIGGKTIGSSSIVSGEYLEYTFSDNNVIVATAASDGVNYTFGSFNILIDGISKGSFNFNNGCDGISDGSNDNQRCPAVLIFDGLADTQHVIRITKTDSDFTGFDYFGHLKKPNLSSTMILVESTRINDTGYAIVPDNANNSIITELNTLINTISNTIFREQYPLVVAKTDTYFDVSTGLDTDNIHPNNIGYRQIYQGCYESVKNFIVSRESSNVTPPSIDAVAYYDFNDNAKEYLSASKNMNTTNVAYSTGKVASGIILNGTTSTIQKYVADFSFTNGIIDLPFTLMGWFNFNTKKNCTFFFKGDTNGGGSREYEVIFISNTNTFYCRIYSEGNSNNRLELTHTFTPSTSTWYHLAMTFDGANINFYIDGVSLGSQSTIGTYIKMTADINPFQIGMSQLSTYTFDGKIDEVVVVASALTSTKINDIITANNLGTPYSDI